MSNSRYDSALTLEQYDPEIAATIRNEAQRQVHHIEPIASEN